MFLPVASGVGLSPSLLAIQGPGTSSRRHAHHLLQAVLARSDALSVQLGESTTECAGVLVPSGLAHAIDGADRSVVVVFLDPEGVWGRDLGQQLGGRARLLERADVDGLLEGLPADADGPTTTRWMHTLLDRLGLGAGPRPAVHPTVRRLIARLNATPLADTPSLTELAAELEISPSRLRHVLKDSLGVTFRGYLRWLRLVRASEAILQGQPLTDAAFVAGFYDAAHMTRTFREMLGVTPSELAPRVH